MRENSSAPRANPETTGTSLSAAGKFALKRHAEARASAPKRSAAMYLRLALTCARHLSRLAPYHPDFWAQAQALVAEVIALAQQHEAELFAQGSNQGTAYLNVWIAAEALRVQLADRAAHHRAKAEQAQPEPALQAPASRPAPEKAPALAASRAPQAPERAHLAPRSQTDVKRDDAKRSGRHKGQS